MSAYQEEGLAPGEHRFATKVDNWLLAVLVTAGIVSVGSILLSASTDPNAAIVSLVMVVFAFGFVIALAFPTHYTIGASELAIRSGILRYRISLDAIQRVYPTRNPLAAPAWSMDRLAIVYTKSRGRGFALVSPERRAEFLDLLTQRAELEPVGKELRRRGSASG